MEIRHKAYGELTRKERDELFHFQLYNCKLPSGYATREPEENHGFVRIWDKKKLVAVGIYRPLEEGERVPDDTPPNAKRFGIRSLDVGEKERAKGYGSTLLNEVIRGIISRAEGPAMIRMDHYPELKEKMEKLGFRKHYQFHYLLFG